MLADHLLRGDGSWAGKNKGSADGGLVGRGQFQARQQIVNVHQMVQVPAIPDMKEPSLADPLEQLEQAPIPRPISFRDTHDGDRHSIKEFACDLFTLKFGDAVDIVWVQR